MQENREPDDRKSRLNEKKRAISRETQSSRNLPTLTLTPASTLEALPKKRHNRAFHHHRIAIDVAENAQESMPNVQTLSNNEH